MSGNINTSTFVNLSEGSIQCHVYNSLSTRATWKKPSPTRFSVPGWPRSGMATPTLPSPSPRLKLVLIEGGGVPGPRTTSGSKSKAPTSFRTPPSGSSRSAFRSRFRTDFVLLRRAGQGVGPRRRHGVGVETATGRRRARETDASLTDAAPKSSRFGLFSHRLGCCIESHSRRSTTSCC